MDRPLLYFVVTDNIAASIALLRFQLRLLLGDHYVGAVEVRQKARSASRRSC